MTTLREHLHATNAAIESGNLATAQLHLIAAEAHLDESKKTFGKFEGRLVLDPATPADQPAPGVYRAELDLATRTATITEEAP